MRLTRLVQRGEFAEREQELRRQCTELEEQLSQVNVLFLPFQRRSVMLTTDPLPCLKPQSENERRECERQLNAFKAQDLERTHEYERVQQRLADLAARVEALQGQQLELVQRSAELATMMNRRIAEQAEENAQLRERNDELVRAVATFPQAAWAWTNDVVRRVS